MNSTLHLNKHSEHKVGREEKLLLTVWKGSCITKGNIRGHLSNNQCTQSKARRCKCFLINYEEILKYLNQKLNTKCLLGLLSSILLGIKSSKWIKRCFLKNAETFSHQFVDHIIRTGVIMQISLLIFMFVKFTEEHSISVALQWCDGQWVT